jgi:hypothetical protein
VKEFRRCPDVGTPFVGGTLTAVPVVESEAERDTVLT